jgi:hypothetical protein
VTFLAKYAWNSRFYNIFQSFETPRNNETHMSLQKKVVGGIWG